MSRSDAMPDETQKLLILGAGWLIYGLLHSLHASLRCKTWVARRLPRLFHAYRLFFNAFALLSALPLIWLIVHSEGPLLIHWQGPWRWLALAVTLCGLGGFLISLRAYDLAEFIGLRQWQECSSGKPACILDAGEFRIGFFNRYVRHPWYFFSLLVLWTQNMNAATLLSAIAITLYLAIGSRFEEHKLIAAYGETYRRYRARVPGLWPLPGKYLTAAEAAELVHR